MIESESNWRIYEFADSRGIGVIEEWRNQVDKGMLARLHQKLDLLELHGSELPPGLLAGTNRKHVDKLRIFFKKVTWRFLICKGPIDNDHEFTVLFVAQEKDRKLIPKDAEDRADANRTTVISNPERRKPYERNYRKTNT